MIPQPPLRVTDSFPQGSLGPYGAAGGHIGPPLRGVGRCSGTNGNWRRTEAFPNGAGRSPRPLPWTGGACGGVRLGRGFRQQSLKRNLGRRGEVTPPYGCATGDAKQRADVPKAWLPPTKFHSKIWGVSHGHRPLRIEGEVSANTQASGAERSVSGAAARDGCVAAKIIPNGAINTGRSRGGRSARQHRAGRGRARPLREHRECRSAGQYRHRPLRKDVRYGSP